MSKLRRLVKTLSYSAVNPISPAESLQVQRNHPHDFVPGLEISVLGCSNSSGMNSVPSAIEGLNRAGNPGDIILDSCITGFVFIVPRRNSRLFLIPTPSGAGQDAGSACNLRPSALITFSTVANSGLPSGDSAL